MELIRDNMGQSAAEMILLFGGMIIIVVFFAAWYKKYLASAGSEIKKTDVANVTNSLQKIKQTLKSG